MAQRKSTTTETHLQYLIRIVKTRDDNECWYWPFGKTGNRYGAVVTPKPHRKQLKAHKLAFKIRYGHWPKPCGLHKCDNHPCFNPRHIFEGTNKDNTEDMIRKGRQAPPRYGVANNLAKVNPEIVKMIRQEYSAGGITQHKLGEKYGISQNAVHAMIARKSWANVS